MRPLYLRYDASGFWEEYWKNAPVDPPRFIDLDIYPIHPALDYLRPEDRVLECGFGGGRVIRHLANTGFRKVVGIEYDRGAAKRLREAERLALVVGDVRTLPFRDASFDATLAFGLLGGLHRQLHDGVREVIRVTTAGGLVVVSLMLDNLARKLQALFSFCRSGPPRAFYAWRGTQREWERLLTESGLQILERAYMHSRHNFYQWAPFLRKHAVTLDQARARVCDRAYPLNAVGEALFRVTRRFFPVSFAGACTFVCRNRGQPLAS